MMVVVKWVEAADVKMSIFFFVIMFEKGSVFLSDSLSGFTEL